MTKREMTPWSTMTLCEQHLVDRGWRSSMIRDFLGEPDRTTPNKKHPTWPDLKLYYFSRVQAAEATAEWRARRAKADVRKAAIKSGQQEWERRKAKLASIVPEPLPWEPGGTPLPT